jgi:hypothetical protein
MFYCFCLYFTDFIWDEERLITLFVKLICVTTKGGSYDVLVSMLEGTLGFHTQNDISENLSSQEMCVAFQRDLVDFKA